MTMIRAISVVGGDKSLIVMGSSEKTIEKMYVQLFLHIFVKG